MIIVGRVFILWICWNLRSSPFSRLEYATLAGSNVLHLFTADSQSLVDYPRAHVHSVIKLVGFNHGYGDIYLLQIHAAIQHETGYRGHIAFDATSFARRSVHNLYSHVINCHRKIRQNEDKWKQEVPKALLQELKEFVEIFELDRYDDLTLSSSFPNSSSSSPNSSSKLSPKLLSSSDMNEVDRLNTCYKFCQLVIWTLYLSAFCLTVTMQEIGRASCRERV